MKRVTVITFADKNAQKYFKYCYPILKQWCDNKKYNLRVFSFTPEEYTNNMGFLQIHYILKTIQECNCDVVFYMNADIVINNMNLDVLEYMNDNKDIYICKNGANLGTLFNAGTILTKCNEKTVLFFQEVLSHKNCYHFDKTCHEQYILSTLYQKYYNLIEPLEMRDLNSHWSDNLSNTPNNNLYHFMARSIDDKVNWIKQHLQQLKNK